MKKFIALVALVLVSASTLMYAQESQRDIRRADRKAQRDAEKEITIYEKVLILCNSSDQHLCFVRKMSIYYV